MQAQLWPIHHKPFHDEILSSWLSRVAKGHDLSLQQFIALCLPRPTGVGFDIDLATDPNFFSAISAGVGVRHEDVIQTTFMPEDGVIYSERNALRLEWITQLRLQCRSNSHIGLPFCPSCLGTDSTPYYRKQWRYGFFPVCPTHGILETQCPNCGHPYAYQGTLGGKIHHGNGAPGNCRGCGVDFSVWKQERSNVASSVADLQSRISKGLSDRWIEIPGRGNAHVYLYLCGLRILASIFQQEHGEKTVAWIARQAKIELPWNDVVPASLFEQQLPKRRTAALFLADWLIQDWPWRFVEMASALNFTSASLLPPSAKRPYWLFDEAIERIDDRRFQPSDDEIESARRVLSRQIQWPVSTEDTLHYYRTAQLPEIKARRTAPAAASKILVKEAADQLGNRYERKKRLTQMREDHGQLLYPPFSSSPGVLRNELDIAEAAEDIDGLWVVTRTARSSRFRDD